MSKTRKWAGAIAIMALMLSAIGMGVGALFTDQGTAVQAVDIGTFDFQLSSTTPDAVVVGDTVTCPAFHIQSSYESDFSPHPTCNITVSQLGSIDNAKVSIYLQVTGTADLTKFWVTPSGGPNWFHVGGATHRLDGYTAPIVIGPPAVGMVGQWIPLSPMPASVDMEFEWPFPGLDNSDLGDSFTATFTVYIYE